eukprot:SAG11_NODE_16516_length_545_cov_1.029148_1_plen_108_part_00
MQQSSELASRTHHHITSERTQNLCNRRTMVSCLLTLCCVLNFPAASLLLLRLCCCCLLSDYIIGGYVFESGPSLRWAEAAATLVQLVLESHIASISARAENSAILEQ